MSDPIAELVSLLSRLPGVGERTAARLAYHLLAAPAEYAQALGKALGEVHGRVRRCERCKNYTTESVCRICTDPRRDTRSICVVARPQDLAALERGSAFRGHYYVLHALLSPLDGIGPDALDLPPLIERIRADDVTEVIIATPLSVEGEATALFVAQELRSLSGVRCTRIASGLPHGGELEYTDQVTLARALDGRRELEVSVSVLVTGGDMKVTALKPRRAADVALFAFVMLTIGMLIVPLPTPLLDLLLASNLALACVVLFTALYVPNALGFATLPTLLLVTTLYRLALNVSSTRLILLQADAGHVIRAFGDFVVQGNYVVGGVVFLILTLIQYLVIAKGSERVAEVGARFSLDAMPGKQLAIDADLRAGALHVDAARKRRAAIEHESQFYGAMDGAMKFVKGDAVAGIAIALISLVGGTAIGVGMHGLTFAASLRRYGLLTIGDGLVAQIPSLVISIAAGLVVTRVASREQDSSLGNDIARQLFAEPRVLGAAAVFLALLGSVPGLPAPPFFVVALVFGVAAYARFRARAAEQAASRQQEREADCDFVIELGSTLFSGLQSNGGDRELALLELCARHVQTLRATFGVVLPQAHLRAQTELPADGYVVRLRGVSILQGAARDAVQLPLLLDDELGAVLRERARELLSIDDVRRALDALAERSPSLVRAVTPAPISLAVLTETLRRLLDEGVSVRPLARVLEALATPSATPRAQTSEAAPDPAALAETARRGLRESIVEPALQDGVLHVHAVDSLIEDALLEATRLRSPGQALPLPRQLAREIVHAAVHAKATHGGPLVLLTQPHARRSLWELLAPELRALHVLSYAELPASTRVEQRPPLSV